ARTKHETPTVNAAPIEEYRKTLQLEFRHSVGRYIANPGATAIKPRQERSAYPFRSTASLVSSARIACSQVAGMSTKSVNAADRCRYGSCQSSPRNASDQ